MKMSLKGSKNVQTSVTNNNNNITNNNSSSSNASNVSSSSSNNTSSSSRDLIKVCVRIRPPPLTNNNNNSNNSNNSNNTLDQNDNVVWKWDEQSIAPAIANPIRKGATNSFSTINAEYFLAQQQQYSFDHVFSPETTTSHIFDSVVKDIVSSAMQGMHGSVFMYGQTASGKTFTMNGTSGHNPQIGIIPQAVKACFEAIDSFPDREFLIRVSYLEVYNEQLKDLLNPEPVNIKILHDPKQNITILTGVKEQVVLNFAQVNALMKQGESQRHVGVTDMNEKSSRAHTIFKIIIESKDRTHQHGPVRVSTLNLIDLAGSESAKMTNSKGQRLQEARHINQSLLALSTIIQRLSEDHSHNRRLNSNNNSTYNTTNNSAHQHLPFRDSKLTRLLETALDGNGKIAIICTISATLKCVEETSNTLKFGARAKLIQMHAKINETVDDKTLLRAYREEIEQLKHRLKELEEKNHNNNTNNNNNINSNNNRNYSNNYDVYTNEDKNYEDNEYDMNNDNMNDNESEDEVEERDEDPAVAAEQNAMLQMILEMERLILKADMTKHNNNNNANNSNSNNNNNNNHTLSVSPSSSSVSSLVNSTDNNSLPNDANNAIYGNNSTNNTSNKNTDANNVNNNASKKANLTTNNANHTSAKMATVSSASSLSQSPMIRGKNGEKRLSLTKLTNISQNSTTKTTNDVNSNMNNNANNNIKTCVNNINHNSRMAPGTQTKSRVVSLTKLAATTANNSAINKAGKSSTTTANNSYSAKKSDRIEGDKATFVVKDKVLSSEEDNNSHNGDNSDKNNIQEDKNSYYDNNDSLSAKKKSNLKILAYPTEANNTTFNDNNNNIISSTIDNPEDLVQSFSTVSQLNNVINNNSNTDNNNIVSNNHINSSFTPFSPAVMASLQLNHLLLRTSPSAGTTSSHGQKGMFFGGLTDVSSVSLSPPHNIANHMDNNNNNTNPKIADMCSQMAVTASEDGVAPPAAQPSSSSSSTTTSQLPCSYSEIPNISESRPHPEMLLLSPARQRLQQHLQQHQHLTRSFYHNNSDNNIINNNINNNALNNVDNSLNARISSNNNSIYRILSSDSFDFPQYERMNPHSSSVISHKNNEEINNTNNDNDNVHNLEETDTVLLHVSKMLLLLKDYIAKPKQTSSGHHHHNHPHSHSKPHRKSTGSSSNNNTNNTINNSSNSTSNGNNNVLGRFSDPTGGQLSPLVPSSPAPPYHTISNIPLINSQSTSSHTFKKSASATNMVAMYDNDNSNNNVPLSPNHRKPLSTSNTSSFTSTTSNTTLLDKLPLTPPPHAASFTLPHNGHSFASSSVTPSMVTVEELHNLKLNLKLKEADNSFLQDEIANKDKMLSLLTEGLKDVEESQKQWLYANQTLSWTLQKERELNVSLWQEIDRLYSVLQRHKLTQELETSPLYAALQGINNNSNNNNNNNNNNNIDITVGNSANNTTTNNTTHNFNINVNNIITSNNDHRNENIRHCVFTDEDNVPSEELLTNNDCDWIDSTNNNTNSDKNISLNAFESY